MEKQQNEEMLQWHPAFFAGLQIELSEDADNLIFENEHQLGTKPKEIDVLIIKKQTQKPVKKSIGKIFRKYNIIEYKSPDDSLSIDDFYKVYAYTYFFKADTGSADGIPADELTITLVSGKYPRELISHLRRIRKYEVSLASAGIYYVRGDFLPIQIIHTKELPEKEYLWLKNLTNDIKESETADKLFSAYSEHKENTLYKSVMDIIMRANMEKFQEVRGMDPIIQLLCKDEIETSRAEGVKNAIELLRELGLPREEVFLKVKNKLDISDSQMEKYMQKYWV